MTVGLLILQPRSPLLRNVNNASTNFRLISFSLSAFKSYFLLLVIIFGSANILYWSFPHNEFPHVALLSTEKKSDHLASAAKRKEALYHTLFRVSLARMNVLDKQAAWYFTLKEEEDS